MAWRACAGMATDVGIRLFQCGNEAECRGLGSFVEGVGNGVVNIPIGPARGTTGLNFTLETGLGSRVQRFLQTFKVGSISRTAGADAAPARRKPRSCIRS